MATLNRVSAGRVDLKKLPFQLVTDQRLHLPTHGNESLCPRCRMVPGRWHSACRSFPSNGAGSHAAKADDCRSTPPEAYWRTCPTLRAGR